MNPEVAEPADGAGSVVGERIEIEVGPVAHGGHFVARPQGRVVFVRHALPGERVTVEITEDSGRYLRGDAVEVHEPSPHRVVPPCPYARPDACGGCDFQHVDLGEQRRLKAAVVEEQLVRLARIEREVVVEEVLPVLGWRSRMQYVDLPDGRSGLRRHRSHDVVPVDRCLIASDQAQPRPVVGEGAARPSVPEEVALQPSRRARNQSPIVETVVTTSGVRRFAVAADGFWQPHVAAPRTLVDCVLEMAGPQPGERVLDLYAGVGLFAGFLAEAVGPEGGVLAVEGDRTAAAHARNNLADQRQVRVVGGRVDRVLSRGVGSADVVVLDPPRVGAKRQVVRAVTALEPRAVVYVACDPAALARDLGYFAEHGYRLAELRAFDLFPMTHHVECVALLEKAPADLRRSEPRKGTPSANPP